MPSAVEDRISIRREIIDLMNEKVKFERQLEALVQVLQSVGIQLLSRKTLLANCEINLFCGLNVKFGNHTLNCQQ